MATQGPRLQALAASRGAGLRYEAAVCGAIPIIRVLDDALAGDRILALGGVVNGTCTAILSAMEAGAEYDEALAERSAWVTPRPTRRATWMATMPRTSWRCWCSSALRSR